MIDDPRTVLGDLRAYGEQEATTALQAKDRDQYQFWQGWNAALQRVAALGDPPGQQKHDEKAQEKDTRVDHSQYRPPLATAASVTPDATVPVTVDHASERSVCRCGAVTIREWELGELVFERIGCTHVASSAALVAIDSPAEDAVREEPRSTSGSAFAHESSLRSDSKRVTAGDPPGGAWQPIGSAPERRKVLVTWVNALGKRRTALASYWPEGTLDMSDDVPDLYVNEEGQNLDAGWWEESEGNEEAMFRLVEKMDFWMPLPAAPVPDGK